MTKQHSIRTKEHSIRIGEAVLATDHQGFLKDRLAWNPAVAHALAERDGVSLSEEHWEIIHYFREYYEDYNIPPPMRMIMRVYKRTFGDDNANSRHLQSLFPEGPTKTASKYAGLPKPKNCK